MNTSFKMIDPANPVHMMSFSGARGTISQVHQLLGMRGLMSDPRGQVIDLPIRRNLREGLSLTEYIISCYGARKGVVDTAVRTSDAGYLTRRLVEVVQHIAVRKKDCETLKSIVFITSKIGEQRRLSLGMMPSRGLIGRVLADHVFWDGRCVATRNQDINDVLANHLIKASQPMLLRSPLTCKSISWICQLCYGWSLAHYDLVELGEAVGIIAGQSIGEPGTQLTLRTFHTGGVFTGDIADYVRIPFNGLTNFNEKSLCPTRTRHGHPAWLCRDDLLLLIGNSAGTQTSFIPARSLLMIRTGQYVESQQVIAEVRIKELPPKECIRKPVYPNSGGEIHWSRFFWSVRDSINNKGRVVQEASHIWILAGAISDLVGNPFFYKDQDRLSFEAYSMKRNGRQSKEIIEPKVGSATYLDLRKGIQAFGNDFVYFKNWSQCPRSNYILSHIKVARSNMDKSESLLLERRKKGFDRLHFVNIEVQLNQVLDESYVLTTDKIEKTRYCSWYRIVRRGVFSPFPISQEIYLTHGFPSFILAKNKNLTKKSTGITSGINPKIDRKKLLEVVTLIRMPSGYLYNINKQVNGFLGGNYIFLVPGKTNKIFAGIEIKNCVSLHPFLACQAKKDSLFPIISLASYDVLSNFITQLPFWGDKPKTQRCARYEILLFLCFKTCKTSQRRKLMNHLTIELIRARLLVKWEKYLHENSLEKKNYISLISVKIGNLLTTFVQVNPLVSIPTRRRVFEVNQFLKKLNNLYKYFLDQVDLSKKCSEPTLNSPNITYLTILGSSESRLTLVPSNLSRANSFFSTNSNSCEQEIMGYFRELDACDNKRENKRDISRFLDFNCFLRDSVTLEVEKNKRVNSKFIQERPNKLGLIGTAWPIVSSSDLSNVSFVDKNLSKLCCLSYQSKRSEKIFRCFHFFDENKVILRCYLNTFGKKDLSQNSIYFSYLFILAKGINQRIVLIILGLLIGENRYLHKDRACLKSGQVIAIDQDYLVIRMGKLILTTRGANPHKISGDIIKEGDTLITLPYDRLKSGDITQGLPKVEQLLESRVIASPPIGLGDLFDRWYQNSTKLIGNAWSQLLSAGRSMEHCQLVLIDQIQKVYESQGVEICDKHLEIIVRQLTSRVVASEDGIIDVFLPGELVEFSQAERMNRVVRRLICYEPILLGMTKASLSTTSFLAEASFQETTRVLAKAALRGRIDWLKGLKENVIIGDIIPVGTGSREVACQLILNKRKESHLGNKVSKNLERDTRDFLTSHRKRRDFTPRLIVSRQFS